MAKIFRQKDTSKMDPPKKVCINFKGIFRSLRKFNLKLANGTFKVLAVKTRAVGGQQKFVHSKKVLRAAPGLKCYAS